MSERVLAGLAVKPVGSWSGSAFVLPEVGDDSRG